MLKKLLVFIGLTLSLSVNAALLTAVDVDDDATLTLQIEDTVFEGVNQQWGNVRIVVVDDKVLFTSGDTIDISVWEDDLVGDDLLFNTSFTVSAAEVADGLVDRTISVIFTPFPDGVGTGLEIFAEAVVDKALCGTFCSFDQPQTGNLNIAITAPPVPIPAAAWLFGSALLGLGVIKRKKA